MQSLALPRRIQKIFKFVYIRLDALFCLSGYDWENRLHEKIFGRHIEHKSDVRALARLFESIAPQQVDHPGGVYEFEQLVWFEPSDFEIGLLFTGEPCDGTPLGP